MDMSILGFYANTKMLEREDVFRHFFCSLSRERQQKIEAIKAEGGRCSSLGAWALMDYGLQQLYGLREREITITYGAHGKPYVKNRPDIHFNLSHSGDYVLAVFAPVDVGCDVQQVTQDTRSKRIAARFFTEKEQMAIADGMDFYRIWVRKESYIKCTGDGMACDLRSFSVEEEKNIHFAEHILPGYAMAVCCKKGVPPVVWKKVDLSNLIENEV